MIKQSLRTGVGFGVTSGVITTLGLIVGLHSGTHSKLVIIGGVLIIAIADAFSDALGIHISEEARHKKNNTRHIWESTLATFITKFLIAITFIIPVVLFQLSAAIALSILWGMVLLSVFSFYIAKNQNVKPWKVISEHLLIAVIVIIITHYVGDLVSLVFV